MIHLTWWRCALTAARGAGLPVDPRGDGRATQRDERRRTAPTSPHPAPVSLAAHDARDCVHVRARVQVPPADRWRDHAGWGVTTATAAQTQQPRYKQDLINHPLTTSTATRAERLVYKRGAGDVGRVAAQTDHQESVGGQPVHRDQRGGYRRRREQ